MGEQKIIFLYYVKWIRTFEIFSYSCNHLIYYAQINILIVLYCILYEMILNY